MIEARRGDLVVFVLRFIKIVQLLISQVLVSHGVQWIFRSAVCDVGSYPIGVANAQLLQNLVLQRVFILFVGLIHFEVALGLANSLVMLAFYVTSLGASR